MRRLIAIVLSLALGSAIGRADGWTPVAPLPDPKVLHGAATGSDGRIYAFGGTSNDGPPVTASVFAYDASADTWTGVTSMAGGPRRHFAYASDGNGLIYAFGGYDFGGPPFALNRVERYDPMFDRWTALPDMPTRRQGPAAATGTDGRIYVIGGTDTSFQTIAVTEIFDPATLDWTAGSPMNTPRTGFAATAGADGLIYVFGGYSGDAYLSTAEAYDPVADTWTSIGAMNEPRYGVAGVTGPDGRVYAIGGGDDGASVEAYDVSVGKWTYVAPMAVGRFGLAATVGPDGRIYAAGGDWLGLVEAFRP